MDDRPRIAFQDSLVNLCFQRGGGVGTRVERSQERGGTRQVAFGLCNIRLEVESIRVVRCDIENLIKLSQRFGETATVDIEKRVLGEQLDVARVEPLGFVEV